MAIRHDRIKEMRIEKGFTLLRVAEFLGVTEATAQRYETGKGIKTIPYDVIEKYANLFGCSPEYFMGWDTKKIEDIASKQDESLQGYMDEVSSKHIAEIINLELTESELQDVVDYAKYLKTKRKG